MPTRFNNLKTSLRTFGNFSEEELDLVTGKLRQVNLAKGHRLTVPGNISREFYFIQQGAFRQYTLSSDNEELISNLYVGGDWLFDYHSLTAQVPSKTTLEATEDSEVFELTIHQFHELIKISDNFFRVGSIFQVALQNQQYQQLRSPEERYALLLEKKPQIIRQFPLKYIASYLGMTPETLSRVRRRIVS